MYDIRDSYQKEGSDQISIFLSNHYFAIPEESLRAVPYFMLFNCNFFGLFILI